MRTTSRLTAESVTLAYDDRVVVDQLSVAVPDGRITVIVGANACGKSTLLRGMSRLLRPRSGAVLLDGQAVHCRSTREVARTLGLLPQQPVVPDGVTVIDLVGRGRHPHQGVLARWTTADHQAVTDALELTDTLDLASRPVDELSGGQRQRVWLAMALAQGTDLLLLDEPTTFLDVAHQVEVLDLLADLNHRSGTTIVMVLHELNLAVRYADHLVAMKAGRVVAEGSPSEVVSAHVVKDVFGLDCQVIEDPVSGTPLVVPVGQHVRRVSGVPGRMTNDANERETYGEYSVDDEDQLPPEDTLEDTGDLLDEGNIAPDHYSAGQRFGNTPFEEERGETLAQRLRQEEPEDGDPDVDDSSRPAEEVAMHEEDEGSAG